MSKKKTRINLRTGPTSDIGKFIFVEWLTFVKKHKYLLIYPIIAAVLNYLYVLIVVAPAHIPDDSSEVRALVFIMAVLAFFVALNYIIIVAYNYRLNKTLRGSKSSTTSSFVFSIVNLRLILFYTLSYMLLFAFAYLLKRKPTSSKKKFGLAIIGLIDQAFNFMSYFLVQVYVLNPRRKLLLLIKSSASRAKMKSWDDVIAPLWSIRHYALIVFGVALLVLYLPNVLFVKLLYFINDNSRDLHMNWLYLADRGLLPVGLTFLSSIVLTGVATAYVSHFSRFSYLFIKSVSPTTTKLSDEMKYALTGDQALYGVGYYKMPLRSKRNNKVWLFNALVPPVGLVLSALLLYDGVKNRNIGDIGKALFTAYVGLIFFGIWLTVLGISS